VPANIDFPGQIWVQAWRERCEAPQANRVEIIRLNSDLRPEGPELHVASPVYGTS
jgi:hypothetical protein